MNERIQKLVDITAERHPGVYNLVYEDGDKGVEFNEVALEHLAELIVLECASICYNSSLKDPDTHAQNLMFHFNIDNCRNDK